MDAALGLPVLFGLIAVALLFDFLNGLHDAANSIATIVSTRVLRPQYAVFWAAFFNFLAFAVFGAHVANTIGTGIIEPDIVEQRDLCRPGRRHRLECVDLGVRDCLVQFACLDRRTDRRRHGQGWNIRSRLERPVQDLIAIVLSPLIGFLLALVLVAIVSWLSVRSTPFRWTASFALCNSSRRRCIRLGHGGNDAQKTMGIIAVLLYSQGYLGDQFRDSVLGGAGVSGRDGAGYADGRLADRSHHGTADNEADADAGILRRDGRRCHLVHGDLSRGSRLHHPHHHRRHRWRWRGAADVGSALECREFDRLRLGDHHSGLSRRRCTDMVGGQDLCQLKS